MEYTKFEKARLIGARALQIMMGAPVLVKVPQEVSKPIDVACYELEKGVLPITVVRKEKARIKRKKILEIPIDDEEGEKTDTVAESFDDDDDEEIIMPDTEED